MGKVEKEYVFAGPKEKRRWRSSLEQHSTHRVSLHVAPEWEAGCPSCSFWADNFNGIDVHLKHRDTSFAAISRAPYEKLKAYRQRMGWNFKWLPTAGNDFVYDLHASYTPEEMASEALMNYKMAKPRPKGFDDVAISVFLNDSGKIYHTYSTYERGLDMLNVAYHYMDLVPKGRGEGEGGLNTWVRRHDEYKD